MDSRQDRSDPPVERAVLVHRELVRLALLIALTVACFIFTRAVAASVQDAARADAAEQYATGRRLLDAGDVTKAVEMFRRAAGGNRGERTYALALAEALQQQHDYTSAEGVLLPLRETAPEDATVNLRLARLSGERQDITSAIRFYHNALYSPWSSEQTDQRRSVRFELIEFLLAHAQASRADAELLILTTDVPNTSGMRTKLGDLFARADDPQHALAEFAEAVRLDPHDERAAVGAGTIAFNLGDYALAGRYLAHAGESGDAPRLRQISSLVLTTDPLADQLTAAERTRRLGEAFAYASERLNDCIRASASDPASSDVALQRDATTFQKSLKQVVRNSETIDEGLGLVVRIGRRVTEQCPPETAFDQALMLIGRRHGASVQ